MQHRATLLDPSVCANHQGQGANHEHHGAPSGGLRKNRRRSARTKSRLAASSAEGASEVSGFAALQKNDDNQDEAIHHEESGEQRARPPKTHYYDCQTNQNGDGPLHPTWHFYLPAQSLTMLANDFASRLAPPTSTPSISCSAINP